MKKIKKYLLLFIIGIFILTSCVTVVNRTKPRKVTPVKRVIIVKPRRH